MNKFLWKSKYSIGNSHGMRGILMTYMQRSSSQPVCPNWGQRSPIFDSHRKRPVHRHIGSGLHASISVQTEGEGGLHLTYIGRDLFLGMLEAVSMPSGLARPSFDSHRKRPIHLTHIERDLFTWLTRKETCSSACWQRSPCHQVCRDWGRRWPSFGARRNRGTLVGRSSPRNPSPRMDSRWKKYGFFF